MASCPYTWFKNMFGKSPSHESSRGLEATYLRVAVTRNHETTVDVSLPAKSARWLIDLIPSDVLEKIRIEGIPIDDIQNNLAQRTVLTPEKIIILNEPHRSVDVWLE